MNKQKIPYALGLDIGSTTVKTIVLTAENEIVFQSYQRHFSDIRASVLHILQQAQEELGNAAIKMGITGSGGLELANILQIPFVQEVIACTSAVEYFIPQTDVAIELGGEDAKITYFDQGIEQRMNGACAGGTGAFIDQMALLLQTDAKGLDDLAKNHHIIYPIASRCGVFAKTDIQPLLNQGAAKEDVAASIFQAVVNQTISGLACGKPIRGHVAFLGGPLHFLPQLRERFIETLRLTDETAIIPENSQYYAAWGCAYEQKKQENSAVQTLAQILQNLQMLSVSDLSNANKLPPLFANEEELANFRTRHQKAVAPRADLKSYQGNAFLGIDAGSTTSKAVLISEKGEILYSYYENNQGEPVELCVKILKDIYQKLPPGVNIAYSAVTGYGEDLIKAALKIDVGEVETMAHYKAAERFLPGVEFILDIGGQDMKAIRLHDGMIDNIILNEACSSGCGSFIETFAKSLDMDINTFTKAAISAQNPVDLGNRCTVFMNSKVKQAQKEGVSVADIAAGLSYSVIKNALYKVIKIRRPEEFGKKILAQGGTFYNEAVLRAFEMETGREVVRPDIAGLMGAYGAAFLALERFSPEKTSSLSPIEELEQFHYNKGFCHCQKCTNHCLLTVLDFADGRQYISGNRCELGAGLPRKKEQLPNLFTYKYQRLFAYTPLTEKEATRGVVGIPRVLNLYENYPFWHTFFSTLGFRVLLSPKSDKKLYEKGMESIPSEAVCYPAKLAHGHIMSLIEQGVSFIFYPSIIYEQQEFSDVDDHFNCPIVAGYPEVIKNNVDELREKGILYKHPFIAFHDKAKMIHSLYECFQDFSIPKKEIAHAVDCAFAELAKVQKDIRQKGEEVLKEMAAKGLKGIVVCGRPYHIDPEINHGLTNLITAEGMAVLTEDSVCHLQPVHRPLRVRDQWAYHSRLYAAAAFVVTRKDLELIQLTSFGCGLDAITSDQVAEILHAKNKVYTAIKIDEGNNLGAARIRIRSLKVTMQEREQLNRTAPEDRSIEKIAPPPFTLEMKKTHTIIVPQLSPIHFDLLEEAMRTFGYHIEVLPKADKNAIEEGLKYVHNDVCYPCILTTGQLIQALKSGNYDLNHVSVIMTQTGGPCRASNYVGFIRKALKDAGMGHVPVIALSAQGLETQPGFTLSLPMLRKAMLAVNYGDLLMQVLYRTRPYEMIKGSAYALYEKWATIAKQNLHNGDKKTFQKNIQGIIHEFDILPLKDIRKPRVGLVGEILVKFSPDANNHIVDIIEAEGGEAVMPGLLQFFLYCTYNLKFNEQYTKKQFPTIAGKMLLNWMSRSQNLINQYLKQSKRFLPPVSIQEIAQKAKDVVSLGLQAGEGWLLTAEMIELIESNANNIVCMQPFACLPNHITGRGALKEIRRLYPQANIVAVDYDPGASESNQLNRIKLMMSVAFKNLAKEQENKNPLQQTEGLS